jgi:hypothetical protein
MSPINGPPDFVIDGKAVTANADFCRAADNTPEIVQVRTVVLSQVRRSVMGGVERDKALSLCLPKTHSR